MDFPFTKPFKIVLQTVSPFRNFQKKLATIHADVPRASSRVCYKKSRSFSFLGDFSWLF